MPDRCREEISLSASQSHLGKVLRFGAPLRGSLTGWRNDDTGEI